MSEVRIEDAGWQAIMDDERLAAARRKLSFHEIRLIIDHARNAGCPFCMGRSSFKGDPKAVFCEDHYRQYRATGAA